jgi:L-cysteine/cystine lyase
MPVMADAPPAEALEDARAQFPVLDRVAYLNAGTFGPLSRATRDAMVAELESDVDDGRSGMPYYMDRLALRERAREALARLVGVDPLHVTLTASTTDGCNIVLGGLDLGTGDEIVTTTDEHFGLLGALGASKARVVVADPDRASILAAVTPHTRLLALSHVLWTTGRVLPVRELRAETGIPILVDGAQSVGAIPVDAGGLDFLTISGQKWLCGPDSTGALVVADPERLSIAAPSSFSKIDNELDGTFRPRPGAARFDPNWLPGSSLAGLLAALEGRPVWAFDRAAAVAERCREMLSPLVEVVIPDERSTLVAFRSAGNPGELVDALHREDVHVREIPGTGLVRVSCGWWTSEGDLERLARALSS